MPAEPEPDLQLQIAHLLLVDVVGYSKLLMNEQVELLQRLNRTVRATECFRSAEAKGKLIRIPTGDGMALLFFENLEEPVRCAIEVAKALKENNDFQVRMGVHSGPVNQVSDVNDRLNIAGTGINIAQRVLDCGDAGHILVSKHVAEDLAQYRQWRGCLQDLGECEVKHGLRLHIFNFCKDGVGNPSVPAKLRLRSRWMGRGSAKSKLNTPILQRSIWAAVLVVSASALIFGVWFAQRPRPTAPASVAPEKSVAVLPFQNFSDDAENAYFADGVQDEILTNLSKVADLKVISRTSVMQYRDEVQRSIRDIAQSLGVSHIVEGSVQRMGNRVRVTAQLIDARNDSHVWAEKYERDVADVFALENELSEEIVAQLKLHLSPGEKDAIEQQPTANLGAYDLYTRAKILIERSVFHEGRRNLLEAVELLNQAVKKDSSFVLAYYQLAHAHDQLYFRDYDRTATRLALAAAAVETVRRLQPDSAEAHLALAKHLYWGNQDFEQARQEVEKARSLWPNEPMSYVLIGYLDRREARWEESIRAMQRAVDLDPRNYFYLEQLALTYEMLRRYSDAEAILDKALTLAPDDAALRLHRAYQDFAWRGNLDSWRAVLVTAKTTEPDTAAIVADWRFTLGLYTRDVAMTEAALRAVPPDMWMDVGAVSLPRSYREARLAQLRGDGAMANKLFQQAYSELASNVRDQPDNAFAIAALAVIKATLGEKAQAVADAQKATDLVPEAKDAVDGVALKEVLALVHSISGDQEAALDELQELVRLPGYLSYGHLARDPLWDGLRHNPRFERIMGSLAPKS